jgi:hypothetical protein
MKAHTIGPVSIWVVIACQFKGGSLTGRFSEDSSTFDAVETLVWGPPGAETTVQRHWKGSKL